MSEGGARLERVGECDRTVILQCGYGARGVCSAPALPREFRVDSRVHLRHEPPTRRRREHRRRAPRRQPRSPAGGERNRRRRPDHRDGGAHRRGSSSQAAPSLRPSISSAPIPPPDGGGDEERRVSYLESCYLLLATLPPTTEGPTGEHPSACPRDPRGDEEEGVSNCRRVPSRPLTVVTGSGKTRE